MRYFILLACLTFVGNVRVSAQENEGMILSHYVFDRFQMGKIFFKTGSTQDVELNYNTLTAEMVFNDGGKYLAISEPEKVDSAVIAGRVFVPGDKKFYELLARSASPLFVEYSSTIKEEGSNLGYGMTSTTTASTPLKSLIQSGGAYNLKLPDGFQVIPKHDFWIFSGGQYRPANSVRQLNSIFPSKKDLISHWVKEHHTDLSKNEDMIALDQAIDKN